MVAPTILEMRTHSAEKVIAILSQAGISVENADLANGAPDYLCKKGEYYCAIDICLEESGALSVGIFAAPAKNWRVWKVPFHLAKWLFCGDANERFRGEVRSLLIEHGATAILR
ncbi:MAG TPA: hypothetical protein VKS79_18215 [Gemmataceae bacterium]|nr:hypothetical protein [Gemmataceae bacterium]